MCLSSGCTRLGFGVPPGGQAADSTTADSTTADSTTADSAGDSATADSTVDTAPACKLATTLSTADQFNEATKHTSAQAIATAPNGIVYVAGAWSYGALHGLWTVRRSTDSGTTWKTVDTYTVGNMTRLGGALVDASGHVHVAGSSRVTTSTSLSWIVRSSTNGTTWNTADTYQPSVGKNAEAASVATHKGSLFVAGWAVDATDKSRWIVRKRLTASWTVVDTYQRATGLSAAAMAIGEGPGGLYAAGSAVDATGPVHWIVRRSVDGGSTWKTVDDHAPGVDCEAAGFASRNGVSYVVGKVRSAGGVRQWVVRSSTSGDAGSWSNVDTFQFVAGQHSWAKAVAIDSNDVIYVGGWGFDGAVRRWVLRRSPDKGKTWSNLETYQLATGKASELHAVTVSPWGDLFAGGSSTDTSGLARWIVRRLPCL